MAITTLISISTGNKVTVNYQSQEVSLSVTYELERQDTDLMKLISDKGIEVGKAHAALWKKIREQLKESQAQTPESQPANQSERQASNAAKPNQASSSLISEEKVEVIGKAAPPYSVVDQSYGERAANAKLSEKRLRGQTTTSNSDEKSEKDKLSENVQTASYSRPPINAPQKLAIDARAQRLGLDERALQILLKERFGKLSLHDLSQAEASKLLNELSKAVTDIYQETKGVQSNEKATLTH